MNLRKSKNKAQRRTKGSTSILFKDFQVLHNADKVKMIQKNLLFNTAII